MVAVRIAVAGLMATGVESAGLRGGAALNDNPIRRVVTMLQAMQNKLTEEGKRDEELFEKYMCYCKNGAKDLEASVESAETKMPKLTSSIQEHIAEKAQLETDLKQHKQDRSDAMDAVREAKAVRSKEADEFAKTSGDYKTNIAALGKAIGLVSDGQKGSFLQTSAAKVVRQLTIDMDLSSADRDIMASFLSAGESSGYAPQSGQISGILKQMKETMEKELAEATQAENDGQAAFEGLLAAKNKEIGANGKAIEAKTGRLGRVGVKIEELKEDLEGTSASYAEDKQFLGDMKQNCATREEEYEVVKKTRAQESLAIAETIKILNDDDALDLFKKTLPSPSLLQVQHQSSAVRQQAAKVLSSVHANGKDTRLDLILLALHGKSVNFDKVLKMVDEMVALLGKEQVDDDAKRDWCRREIDKVEDEHKKVTVEVDDGGKLIDDLKTQINTLTEEIAALAQGIKDLDKAVADATAQRKAENEEYKATMAANTAAKQLINFAKNRLNKFYNPSMYIAPPKRELSREDKIVANFGGAAFVQITAHSQRGGHGVAPPPPPQAVAAYAKKGEESTGVLALVDLLIADLDKEMQELTADEEAAQKAYEKFIADSRDKRALMTKDMETKMAAKADAECDLNKAMQEKKSDVKVEMNTAKVLANLHGECDWLLQNYDARKEARAGEIDSLKKAKAILSGADFA